MTVPSPDERDVNQLIFDLAEYGNRRADVQELYRRLPSMELFAKVLEANFPIETSGTEHVIGSDEKLGIQAASLPSGQTVVQFFVDRSDPRLQPEYVSMRPREACEMVLKMDNLDGLMLCNPTDSWIASLNPELERLLSQELAEPLAVPGNVGDE